MFKHTYIFLLTIFVVLVSAGLAQSGSNATSDNSAVTFNVETQASADFPYFAEITGDDVYIRSGAGTSFYECGKLNTGDKVQVFGSRYTWSQIAAPSGCFSWISTSYVQPDPANPNIGTVTGDSVRVYAGSDMVRANSSTSFQTKLDKGHKVTLLGEQMDNYYKITPPEGAYLWVSTQFTKPITAEAASIDTQPAAITPLIAVTPAEDGQPDINDANMITEERLSATPAEANGVTVTAEPAKSPEQILTEKYNELKAQLEAERLKPIDQQDYSAIREGFESIITDENAGKIARYSEVILNQLKSFELAVQVNQQMKQQSQDLQKTQERIINARTAQLAEIKDLGKYAVIGKLATFLTLGQGHYRVLDESGKTICIASPAQQAGNEDYTNLIGKKVGIIGTIQSNTRMALAVVQFSQIDVLE